MGTCSSKGSTNVQNRSVQKHLYQDKTAVSHTPTSVINPDQSGQLQPPKSPPIINTKNPGRLSQQNKMNYDVRASNGSKSSSKKKGIQKYLGLGPPTRRKSVQEQEQEIRNTARPNQFVISANVLQMIADKQNAQNQKQAKKN